MGSAVDAGPLQLPLLDYPAVEKGAGPVDEPGPSQVRPTAWVATGRDEGGRWIDSERRLAQLACLLGATGCGGPLSPAEQALVAGTRHEGGIAPHIAEEMRRAIRAGRDPLGDALCLLRPAPVRRTAGAFYTPPAIVEAMARWLLARPLARVVDPGCGSGRLAAAVARHRPDLPVVAVDTDPWRRS